MAKHQGERATSLFNKHRREIHVIGGMGRWKDDKDRMHARLKLKMRITSHPLLGMPDFLSQDFKEMEKTDSLKFSAEFAVYMTGMAVDLFPNPTQEQPTIRLTECELDKFWLEKVGTGDNASVWLHWQLDTPNNKLLYDEMWGWYNGMIYMVCDYDASTLPIEDTQNDEPAPQQDFFERIAEVAGEDEGEDEDEAEVRAHRAVMDAPPTDGTPVVVSAKAAAKKVAAKKTPAKKAPATTAAERREAEDKQVRDAKKALHLM